MEGREKVWGREWEERRKNCSQDAKQINKQTKMYTLRQQDIINYIHSAIH